MSTSASDPRRGRDRPQRRVCAGVCAVILLCLSTSLAQARGLGPAVKADLSFMGAGVKFPFLPLVQFTGDRTLAVGFVVRNPGPVRLARRGQLGPRSPYILKVAIIDVALGRVMAEASWPTNSLRHSGLVAAPSSKLVVMLGDVIVVCDDKLNSIGRTRLPGEAGSAWLAHPSPSGRTILFTQDAGLAPSLWALVRIGPLRIVRTWTSVTVRASVVSASDDYVVFSRCRPSLVPPCELGSLSLRTGGIRAIARASYLSDAPVLVGPDLAFISSLRGPGFCVVDVRRRRTVLEHNLLLGGNPFRFAVTARDVRRFVTPALGPLGDVEYLSVVDGPQERARDVQIEGASVGGWPAWFIGTPNWLTLSPDGTLLALMPNFRTVLIYKLPPPKHPNRSTNGQPAPAG